MELVHKAQSFISENRVPIVASASILFLAWYSTSEWTKNRHYPSDLLPPKNVDLENYFRPKSNHYLFKHSWKVEKPVGVLFIVHGYGEHILRNGYHILSSYFNNIGVDVHGIDHAGYGQSSGTRGFTPSIHQYVDDYIDYIDYVMQDYDSDIPTFIFGHSMGGLITALIAEKRDFNGVIMNAPIFSFPVPDFVAYMAFGPLSYFFPKLKTHQLDLNGMTRNEEATQAYINDPKVLTDRMKSKTLYEMFRGVCYARERLRDITSPLLLIHSHDDTICPYVGGRYIFDHVGSNSKEFIELYGVRHEFFEDEESEQIFERFMDWVGRIMEISD